MRTCYGFQACLSLYDSMAHNMLDCAPSVLHVYDYIQGHKNASIQNKYYGMKVILNVRVNFVLKKQSLDINVRVK